MIIWVDDHIFSNNCHDVDRIVLLRNAALRKHTLIISEHVSQEYNVRKAPHFETWAAQLPVRLNEEVRILQEIFSSISANLASHGGGVSLLVTERVNLMKRNICQLCLVDAIRAISMPLYIMVENQINDGAFLRHVLPPLWRSRIKKWEQSGELRFIQGGGNSEIARLIEFHADEIRSKLAFGLPSAIWRLTHFIIYDHDGDSEAVPGEGAANLDTLCRNTRTLHHRLGRRTQEHYLPFGVLNSIINKRITNPVDRNIMLVRVADYFNSGRLRHFTKLPQLGDRPFFKSEFTALNSWSDDLAEKDEIWPEMARLAEKIAAAV